ncbi:glycosyltransferase [Candidatus Saccharibacteria bacterium]|nr:glycosyltransferase [Candidatus Saccharibacteria bacterium]
MNSINNSAVKLNKDVKTSQHATRYFFVGVTVTVFNYILYAILSNLLIKDNNLIWLSSLIATVITTIVAYIAHSKITWKERHVTKASIIRFFIWNALITIIISPTLTQLFSLLTPLYEFVYNITNSIHLPFTYEFVLTTGAFTLTSIVIMVLNFLFYDKFVFPKSKSSKAYSSCNAFPDVKVSVIIPVYNTAKYLPACLDSVLAETHRDLEVICVNDGSTDKSPTILKKYVNQDSRIKVINQKNQGLSAARNAGLKTATGDYITFIDSDDEVKPEMIESLLKALKDSQAGIAACSFAESFPSGKIKSFNKNYPETTYNTENALKAMLKEIGFNVTATMKLFSRNTLKGVKFPIGKLHEDVGTTYKAILKAKNLIFVPEDYYVYHHHDSSIINNFSDQKFDLITLTDQMCDDIEKKYPDLKNAANERRMRARFSILRQIPIDHPKVKSLQEYLKTHQKYITKNPEASKTDKIALKLALTNVKLFQLAYKLFK